MTDVHERLRDWWNRDAETYDRSASHALTDPVEAAAWRAALVTLLPSTPGRVLDVGAGTGAMTLLAAELGHRVTALDLSEAMLDQARAKAAARALDVEFVVGRSTDPPPGPFDAVMERHLLWTTPDPVAALTAWRLVAPDGRLLLFEGTWGGDGPARRARHAAAGWVRRARGVQHDHHAEYDPEVLAALPLAGQGSPGPMMEAVTRAGWRGVRIHRLRDVEWARRRAAGMSLGWLEHIARYAIVAGA